MGEWLLVVALSFGSPAMETIVIPFESEVECLNKLRAYRVTFEDDGRYPFAWFSKCYEIMPIGPWPWSQVGDIQPSGWYDMRRKMLGE